MTTQTLTQVFFEQCQTNGDQFTVAEHQILATGHSIVVIIPVKITDAPKFKTALENALAQCVNLDGAHADFVDLMLQDAYDENGNEFFAFDQAHGVALDYDHIVVDGQPGLPF